MAKSFGGAISEGGPVIMTSRDGKTPEVMYRVGKEVEALELLEKMGYIKRVFIPDTKS